MNTYHATSLQCFHRVPRCRAWLWGSREGVCDQITAYDQICRNVPLVALAVECRIKPGCSVALTQRTCSDKVAVLSFNDVARRSRRIKYAHLRTRSLPRPANVTMQAMLYLSGRWRRYSNCGSIQRSSAVADHRDSIIGRGTDAAAGALSVCVKTIIGCGRCDCLRSVCQVT